MKINVISFYFISGAYRLFNGCNEFVVMFFECMLHEKQSIFSMGSNLFFLIKATKSHSQQ